MISNVVEYFQKKGNKVKGKVQLITCIYNVYMKLNAYKYNKSKIFVLTSTMHIAKI